MRILRCLYLQQQSSLLNEELSEARGLFEIEHAGQTGMLRYDACFHKRDADVELYCDVPGVDADKFANGYQQEPPFYIDEEVWNHTPEATEPTPEVNEHVIRLTSHKIGGK